MCFASALAWHVYYASEVSTNVCEFLGFGCAESDVIVAHIRGEVHINGKKAIKLEPLLSNLREEMNAIQQEPESDSRRAKMSNFRARVLEFQSQSEATARALKNGYHIDLN